MSDLPCFHTRVRNSNSLHTSDSPRHRMHAAPPAHLIVESQAEIHSRSSHRRYTRWSGAQGLSEQFFKLLNPLTEKSYRLSLGESLPW